MNRQPVMMLLSWMLLAFAAGRTVDKEIHLRLRTRIQPFHAAGPETEANFDGTLIPAHAAIIITDIWDMR